MPGSPDSSNPRALVRSPVSILSPASILCALGLAVALLTSCGGSGSGSQTAALSNSATAERAAAVSSRAELPATVESVDGKSVTVRDVSRIVSLRGPISEVIFALGLGANVVGRDVSTTLDEAADVELVTNGHDMSAEAILSLNPTVVLADSDAGPPEAIGQLRSAGIPVVIFTPSVSVEGIESHMIEVATTLGLRADGQKLASDTMARIAEVTGRYSVDSDEENGSSKRPTVAFLYLRGAAGVYLLGGPGSGADSMIRAAGGTDLGTSMGLKRAFTPLTSEALVKAQPDVLLVTTTGLESVGGIEGLLSTPGVAQTPAGRSRRIVTIEDGLLYSFGTRTPEAVRDLAESIRAPGKAKP